MTWDGNGYRPKPEHRPGQRVTTPSGLCGLLGCVFLYGHRGLHSWAKSRVVRTLRRGVTPGGIEWKG